VQIRPTAVRACAVSLLGTACLLVGSATAASAHSAFQDALPEPGQRVEEAPRQIVLVFTEPLNGALTRASLVNVASGRRVPVRVSFAEGTRLVVTPRRTPPAAPYRVDWHTVSRLDGHALEGSFGFGVRTAAVGRPQRLEQSPLARDGWARVALRTVFYASLFFFGGCLLPALMLSPASGPTAWLVPALDEFTPSATTVASIWRRARIAGWLGAGVGLAVALVETADAAGSITLRALDRYLLSTPSGAGRVVAVAALAARRSWRRGAGGWPRWE
jgi:methionine-rich copper-binding protein CopC